MVKERITFFQRNPDDMATLQEAARQWGQNNPGRRLVSISFVAVHAGPPSGRQVTLEVEHDLNTCFTWAD